VFHYVSKTIKWVSVHVLSLAPPLAAGELVGTSWLRNLSGEVVILNRITTI